MENVSVLLNNESVGCPGSKVLWKRGDFMLCKRLNTYNYLYWHRCSNGAAEAAGIAGREQQHSCISVRSAPRSRPRRLWWHRESESKKKQPPWDACDKTNWQSSSQLAWHWHKEKEWLMGKTAFIFFPQNLTKQEAYVRDYSNEMYRLNTKKSLKYEKCLFKWHWGKFMVSLTFRRLLLIKKIKSLGSVCVAASAAVFRELNTNFNSFLPAGQYQ